MSSLTRRYLLASGGAMLAGAPIFAPEAYAQAGTGTENGNRPVRIGLIADAQYADIDPVGTRFYRASVGKLEQALDHFNGQDLDFCVHLGDLIDKEWNSFDDILKPLARSRHVVHQLLGNHDFAVLDAMKPRVPGRMGMKRRYYAFDRGGFRFVALDTTEVSTYAHPADSPEQTAAAAELQRLQAAKVPHAQSWNSGVSPAQLKWFEAQCREAAGAGRKVIVFAHHPVFPANVHNLWNCDELLAALERQRNVVAWFNGHNHAGNFGTHHGIPFLTLRGMVETADTNAHAVATLHPDRIVLTGHGREPSRELPLVRK